MWTVLFKFIDILGINEMTSFCAVTEIRNNFIIASKSVEKRRYWNMKNETLIETPFITIWKFLITMEIVRIRKATKYVKIWIKIHFWIGRGFAFLLILCFDIFNPICNLSAVIWINAYFLKRIKTNIKVFNIYWAQIRGTFESFNRKPGISRFEIKWLGK